MKLSIIIPVYNNYQQLKKCLDSISKQSFKDYEIIVVDDGSNQQLTCLAGRQAINNQQFKDLKISYYKIKHAGAPKARNFGFSKSRGEYVFFCDADVIFLKKHSLQKFVDVLDNNKDIDFAYSQFKFGWKKFPCQKFNIEDLKKNNYISGNSMTRRSALEKISKIKPWDENLTKFQDWDLWLSLVKRGSYGKLIPEVLWHVQSGGTMSKWLPGEKFNFYKFFPKTKSVQEFEKAKNIIFQKHKNH